MSLFRGQYVDLRAGLTAVGRAVPPRERGANPRWQRLDRSPRRASSHRWRRLDDRYETCCSTTDPVVATRGPEPMSEAERATSWSRTPKRSVRPADARYRMTRAMRSPRVGSATDHKPDEIGQKQTKTDRNMHCRSAPFRALMVTAGQPKGRAPPVQVINSEKGQCHAYYHFGIADHGPDFGG